MRRVRISQSKNLRTEALQRGVDIKKRACPNWTSPCCVLGLLSLEPILYIFGYAVDKIVDSLGC
jgi:hypothetical protein